MQAEYPNLQLLEYIFKEQLCQDNVWIEKQKDKKHKFTDIEVLVFPQLWGSTNTAFDICKDGTPAIGGCAMTKAYTTVFRETQTEIYGIFIGNRPCYMVCNPSPIFYKDLGNYNMASLSQAKERY